MADGRCKVAWSLCCRPKFLGGLGISDLHRVGIALWVRWVWRACREGELVVRAEPAIMAFFHAAIVLSLGDGR